MVVVIPASDQWPGETNDMAGKRHRTVVENLIVPSGVEVPLNKKAAAMLSGYPHALLHLLHKSDIIPTAKQSNSKTS